MSLELFPPRAIIGYVNMNGQKLPVEMSPEFYRALRALVARVGGAASDGTADSISDIFARVGGAASDGTSDSISDIFASFGQASEPIFLDVVQPVSEPIFLDVVQPVQSRVLLPEIVQTPTDNSFANETTYA